jgi:hypothetical protein
VRLAASEVIERPQPSVPIRSHPAPPESPQSGIPARPSDSRTQASGEPGAVHRQVFIPVGVCWLNLQEGWWRLFRHAALAGQSFAYPKEVALATEVATCQLNARARPWVWGRPAPSPHYRRQVLTYRM